MQISPGRSLEGYLWTGSMFHLDGGDEAVFQQWIDEVLSRILGLTDWMEENVKWKWVISEGAFLLYFRSSAAQVSHIDSPYSNTVNPHPFNTFLSDASFL